MSFSEDCVRFGDRLARLVDAGIPVKEAAVVVGLSRGRCYAILRAIGRPVGRTRGSGKGVDQRGVADRDVIVAVFEKTGSINQAAKSVSGVAFGGASNVGRAGSGHQREDPAGGQVRGQTSLLGAVRGGLVNRAGSS